MNSTADGSLYFNIVDLAKWDDALRCGKVLDEQSLAAMWTPALLNDGEPNSAGYGFAWACGGEPGHRTVAHGGAWQGFTCYFIRYLDDDLSVAVLTNLSSGSPSNPGKIARHVAEMIKPQLKPAEAEAK
jgi:CubicO group peptidase (beta-lactamase class C family)